MVSVYFEVVGSTDCVRPPDVHPIFGDHKAGIIEKPSRWLCSWAVPVVGLLPTITGTGLLPLAKLTEPAPFRSIVLPLGNVVETPLVKLIVPLLVVIEPPPPALGFASANVPAPLSVTVPAPVMFTVSAAVPEKETVLPAGMVTAWLAGKATVPPPLGSVTVPAAVDVKFVDDTKLKVEALPVTAIDPPAVVERVPPAEVVTAPEFAIVVPPVEVMLPAPETVTVSLPGVPVRQSDRATLAKRERSFSAAQVDELDGRTRRR